MFFQNLSTATEIKGTNARPKSKKPKSDDEISSSAEAIKSLSIENKPQSPDTETDNSGLHPATLIKLEIIYNQKNPQIPRDLILRFLDECGREIMNKENIRDIIDKQAQSKKPLNEMLTEFQRDVLEFKFQIDRDYGCQYLGMIPKTFVDDLEMLNAAKRFMFICMRSYVDALKLRHELFPSERITNKITRNEILEFFEGCNALMVMPETKKTLKLSFEETKKPPNELCVTLQRSVLNLLGLEADFGIAGLNAIGVDYPDDMQLKQKMQHFVMCAQVAVKEATMTEEQRKEFYSEIPPFMHYAPHMYVLQKQAMAQNMGHNHQHQHMSGPPPPGPPSSSSSSPGLNPAGSSSMTAEQAQSIRNLMSNPESRARMQALSGRLTTAKSISQSKVTAWDDGQRSAFLEEVVDTPLIRDLNELDVDPILRLQRFMSMSDMELEQLLSLQLVMDYNLRHGERHASRHTAEGGALWQAMSNLGGVIGFGANAGGYIWLHKGTQSFGFEAESCSDGYAIRIEEYYASKTFRQHSISASGHVLRV
eukprot:gene8209-16883_t